MRRFHLFGAGLTICGLVLAFSALAVPEGPPDVKFTYDAVGRLTGVYNLQTDPLNCGALNNVCSAYPGAGACCVAGTCGFQSGPTCLAGEPVSVSVAPASVQVQVGAAAQFTASVSNSSNPLVLWYVNGIPGGSQQFGTIDSNGGYTAPLAVPNPSGFYVQALSLADYTTFASSWVTIAPLASVNVSPASASIPVGQPQQFTATVSGGGTTIEVETIRPLMHMCAEEEVRRA